MYLDSESIRQSQRSICNVPIRVFRNGGYLTMYWQRIVEDSMGTLLTGHAKHTVYEIEYAMKGPLTMLIDKRRVTIQEGEFLIVPPGVSHQIVTAARDGVKIIIGFLPSSSMEGMQVSEPIAGNDVVHQLAKILLQIQNPSQELMHTLLKSLMHAFLDVLPATNASVGSQYDNEQCVKFFMSFVESVNGVGISVKSAAKMVSRSERQLLRCCLAVTGCSPSEIIHRARMKYIRSRLTDTRLSLSEIAELAGFQSEYAMTRFFKRREGALPSAYRKQANDEAGDREAAF